MTDCAKVERIISAWADSGSVDGSELRSVAEHVEHCPACARRHGALLPLLERDGGMPEALLADDHAPPGSAARIMEAVSAARARPLLSNRRPAWPLAAAAAVLLLLAAGAVAYRVGKARGGESAQGVLVVRFELAAPEAKEVLLIGDFTEWREQGLRLVDDDRDGLWEVTVRLRKGRAYAYNFLIDDEQWIVDPKASVNVDDGFGGMSSVIVI